jgi:hypothetical protein
MGKLDYILPMLVGVLAFVNFLWMMTLQYYDLGFLSIVISGACIIFAKMEHERKQNDRDK